MAFPKGVSGNPGGRPKKTEPTVAAIREFALSKSEEAIRVIYALLKSDDEKIRHLAASSILDRALGKPAQAVEVAGKDGGELVVNVRIAEKSR